MELSFFEIHNEYMEQINEDRKKSGKLTLNEENIAIFTTRQCSEIRNQAAKDLIDCTIYVTLDDIFLILEERIEELMKNINNSSNSKPIAFITGDKKKSSYFITHIAYDIIMHNKYTELIPEVVIDNINLYEELLLENKYRFIMFDDISYSGSQLTQILYNIYYDFCFKKNIDIQLYVCLLYTNTLSYKKLSVVPKRKLRKSFDNYIETPFKIICGKPLPTIVEKIGIKRTINLLLFFSPFLLYTIKPYISIYLDIKIADAVSTFKFALQYGPIIPTDYLKDNENNILESIGSNINDNIIDLTDRTIVNKIQLYDYVKNIIKTEQAETQIDNPIYLPLINNCESNVSDKLEHKKYGKYFQNYYMSIVPDNIIDTIKTEHEYLIEDIKDVNEYIEFLKDINNVNNLCPSSIYKKNKYTKIKHNNTRSINRKSINRKSINRKSINRKSINRNNRAAAATR